MDEYKAAGILGAVFGFALLVLCLVNCDDGRDLIDPAQPQAAVVGVGCAPAPKPDAGCEPCASDAGACQQPACGRGGFGE